MKTWVVSLTLTAAALIFAFSVLTQGSPPADPFLPYADLLTKDQTLDAIESRKFSCEFALLEASQICSLRPEDGIFSEVSVTIVNAVPKSISFQVIENRLRVGDLVVLWDKPEKQTIRSVISWSNSTATRAIVPSAGHLDYLAPVRVVSFAF